MIENETIYMGAKVWNALHLLAKRVAKYRGSYVAKIIYEMRENITFEMRENITFEVTTMHDNNPFENA